LTQVFAKEIISFDQFNTGALPSSWSAGITGDGKDEWLIIKNGSAPSPHNVLQHRGQATFSWCVKDAPIFKDGSVAVKIRLEAGKEDQAGGLVWRWKDANNYYIGRINALEDNVTIFSMIKGQRRSLKSIDIKIPKGTWKALQVDFKGSHIALSYDGKKVLETDNDDLSGAGKAGVWTKADSETSFDDFSIHGT
jgi:hypothetical protein